MFRIPNFAKMAVMAATTLVACQLISSAPAEARWRGNGGHGARMFHAPAARMVYRPAFRPRYVARPRYIAAPVYQPYPVYGYRCVIKKRWVMGPFGPFLKRKRVCY